MQVEKIDSVTSFYVNITHKKYFYLQLVVFICIKHDIRPVVLLRFSDDIFLAFLFKIKD